MPFVIPFAKDVDARYAADLLQLRFVELGRFYQLAISLCAVERDLQHRKGAGLLFQEDGPFGHLGR